MDRLRASPAIHPALIPSDDTADVGDGKAPAAVGLILLQAPNLTGKDDVEDDGVEAAAAAAVPVHTAIRLRAVTAATATAAVVDTIAATAVGYRAVTPTPEVVVDITVAAKTSMVPADLEPPPAAPRSPPRPLGSGS